jgi:hypothetical protein
MEVKMGRSSELFVIAALMLLVFSLIARFISPSALGISITWRGTGYVLPPGLISIAFATLLLHFGLTALGILVFLVAFYLAQNSRAAVRMVFAAPAGVLLVQSIFVWNLLHAVFRAPRLHS